MAKNEVTIKTAAGSECDVFKTKDYWLIIYLISCYPIQNIEMKEDDRKQHYLLWSFPLEAAEEEKRYNRGEAMMIDVHKAKNSSEIFKRNLQHFQIRRTDA